jgi:hypothetical protein
MKEQKTVTYRLYIGLKTETGENIDPGIIPKMVSTYFPGSTILLGRGYWDGKPEPVSIVEIILPADAPRIRILDLGRALKRVCLQKEIWIESRTGKVWIL